MMTSSNDKGVTFVAVAGSTASGKTTLSRALVRLVGSASCVATPINLDWFLDASRMPLYDTDKLVKDDDEEEEDVEQQQQQVRNWETPAGVRYDLLETELRRLKEYLLVAEQQQKNASHGKPSDIYTLNAVNPRTVKLEICWKNTQSPIFVVVEGFLLYCQPAVVDLLTIRFWIETSWETALQRRLNRDLPTRLHHPDECAEFEAWFRRAVWKYYEQYRSVQVENGEPLCLLQAEWTAERQLQRVQAFLLEHDCFKHYNGEECNCDVRLRADLERACEHLQAEIAQDSVPILTSAEDRQAMDWVREAEEAEKHGEMDCACALYRKVINQSPKVAEFLGL